MPALPRTAGQCFPVRVGYAAVLAQTMPVTARYVGWDVPNEFVVGYGLDFAQRYRNLRAIGVLSPEIYS